MKDANNNKTSGAVLVRGIDTLFAINNTPVATTKEVQRLVMPDCSIRTVQRYLAELEQLGLVRRHGNINSECRYYLSGKAKQLFLGVCMKSKRKAPNEDLRDWLLKKSGRGSALAKKLNHSRQYISTISKMDTGISLGKWEEIQWAMLEVESNEQGAAA